MLFTKKIIIFIFKKILEHKDLTRRILVIKMKYIKLQPLCADSLGTRSMALFLETPDIRILIDPNATLSMRYKLVPHPIEYKTLRDCIQKIFFYSQKCKYIFISHYHYDHYIPFFEDYTFMSVKQSLAEDLYKNKIIFLKDIESNIDSTQQRRGSFFYAITKKIAEDITFVDGQRFELDNTILQFSPPIPHGELEYFKGFVIMIIVMYDIEKFIFAPDIYGIISTEILEYIIKENPDWIYLGGPPLYLKSIKIGPLAIKKSKENLLRLASKTNIIIDHHLVRSHDWKSWLQDIKNVSEHYKKKVLTVAEFLNVEHKLYEANRDSLWLKDPPDDRFVQWSKFDVNIRKTLPPPI